MTGPDDSHANTRPISVAELLARNGTIGAPPVGGRRRRRRGGDSVTVAELTGEIPIVREATPNQHRTVAAAPADTAADAANPRADAGATASANGTAVEDAEGAEGVEGGSAVQDGDDPDQTGTVATEGLDPPPTAEAEIDTDGEAAAVDIGEEAGAVDIGAGDYAGDYADAVADYTAHIEERETDPDPVEFFAPTPRRPSQRSSSPGYPVAADAGAEQMRPDPFGPDDEHVLDLDETDVDTESALDDDDDDDALPSYLRSTQGALFGGQTVVDDLARRRAQSAIGDLDEPATHDEHAAAAPSRMSAFLRGALVVGQCIVAVAFGAGMFVAFDQLWKWNNIVALVLSVLVILGLVVGVRVVRKTEDIGSTLIAVAVGALVTLGPLALLQSG